MSELRPFVRYLSVAVVVDLFTVGLREALVQLLPDTPGQYAWTMLVAFGVGMVLSYVAQARGTFASLGHRPTPGLGGFAAVALLSALLTALGAYVLRYLLPLETRVPSFAAPLAFGAAALLVAPVSFLLGRQLVFVAGRASGRHREAVWVWPTLLVLVAVHAALFDSVMLRYNPDGFYDDALFMRLASSLLEGRWLGAYSDTTLVKGPGFPFWLVAVHASKVPVSVAAALTYAMSCLLVFVALRPALPSERQRALLFVVLLFCPVALSDLGVMRELIYPALTLLVVACGVGMTLRLTHLADQVQPWLWAATLGLASAQFVLTREEFVWLAPLWLGVLVCAVRVWRASGISGRALLSAVGVAGLFAVLPVLVVASLNWHHYGVLTVLEFNSRPFVSAYGALARVRRDDALPQVPVPRVVWDKAAAVSPAFAEVKLHMQGELGSIWVGPSVGVVGHLMDSDPAVRTWLSDALQYPVPPGDVGGAEFLQGHYRDDAEFRRKLTLYLGGVANTEAFLSGAMERETGGGWFVWLLRAGAAAAGHHDSAAKASHFYQQLADEVNAACDAGKLACGAERHTLRPVLQWLLAGPFWSSLVHAGVNLLTLPTLSSTGGFRSRSGQAQLAPASAFLHQALAGRDTASVPVAPLEWLIAVYQQALPWLTGLGLAGWLWAAPRPGWRLDPQQRALWWTGGLLAVLVAGRLALLALIHVTAWPAASDPRYLSAAAPLLLWFDVIGVLLASAWWRRSSASNLEFRRRSSRRTKG